MKHSSCPAASSLAGARRARSQPQGHNNDRANGFTDLETAGVAKSINATFAGLHGVFKTIAEQHGEVAALLKRAQSGDDKFAELWPKIRVELLSHEKAEVREAFSVLSARPSLATLSAHHDEEAMELEIMIKRLDALSPSADGRTSLFNTLVSTVLHHAETEENEIFPQAQAAIGVEDAGRLDEPFLNAKREVAESLGSQMPPSLQPADPEST